MRKIFLGFFPFKEKKAVDLKSAIFTNLENDGLDILMDRAQVYDNAATMALVKRGVQYILKEKKAAIFNGCLGPLA